MDDKGQALVEFILIVPVLLLIVLALFDIGNIFIKKYELNNDLETVATLYENGDKTELALFISSEDLKYNEEASGDFVKLTISKNVKVSAPILSNVLGKNFKIETSKNVYQSGDANE